MNSSPIRSRTQNYAERICPPDVAHSERRIVGPYRPSADKNGVALGSKSMTVASRRLTGDPL